jgi:hypothetical protein
MYVDGRMDITKLLGALRDHATAPQNVARISRTLTYSVISVFFNTILAIYVWF